MSNAALRRALELESVEAMNEPMREKSADFIDEAPRLNADSAKPARLRREKVPQELWPLIPYAELWGISDDRYRIEVSEAAPSELWRGLHETVSKYEKLLMAWLTEPEADQQSPEYAAFSVMTTAYLWPRNPDVR